MAYFRIEPSGFTMDNIRAGLGPAVFVNANRAKGSAAIGPLDFFEAPEKKSPEDTQREIAERMRSAINAAGNPSA